MSLVVRDAAVDDVEGMVTVHVDSWQETYSQIMPREVLYAPDRWERRTQMWRSFFRQSAQEGRKAAVAELDGRIVGISMAGLASDEDRRGQQQLFVLYAYQFVHGSGVGARLLEAVIEPGRPASLWVADANPRAQAFYRKQGFAPDGCVKEDGSHGVREIRMVRGGEE